ncbi:hypothetical protein O3Q48_04735 [Enterococcus lactis]
MGKHNDFAKMVDERSFSSTVSARALIINCPFLNPVNPHFMISGVRLFSSFFLMSQQDLTEKFLQLLILLPVPVVSSGLLDNNSEGAPTLDQKNNDHTS